MGRNKQDKALKFAKGTFRLFFKIIWKLLIICVKLYLGCFYIVSKLLELSLSHFNKAIEQMLLGKTK